MSRLADKIAVITGAGSGIGLATTRLFAREGARIAAVDKSGADDVAAAAREAGSPDAFAVTVDVAEAAGASSGIARIVERFGRIDVLLTAAGISLGKRLADTTPEEWDLTFAVNVRGTFLWVQAAMPHMLKAGRGSVITVASQLAVAGGHTNLAYIASKGAILSLTRTLAVDHARDGIRVNTLVPGAIDTPLLQRSLARNKDPQAVAAASQGRHAMGRFGRPEEVAEAALYLASDASSFTTGAEIRVDGGWLAA